MISFFRNEFKKISNTGARMLNSILTCDIKITLKSHFLCKIGRILSHRIYVVIGVIDNATKTCKLLFLYIYISRSETSLKHFKKYMYQFSYSLISLNKIALASNFRTSLRRNNAIDTRDVFANKSIGDMLSQGRNTFACYVMQTNQGPV